MTLSRSRSTLAVLAAGAAVLATTGVTASAASATPGAASPPAAVRTTGPGVCPKAGALTFTSTLSNGMVKLGKSATVSGSTGRACGVINPLGGKLVATIKPANTAFAPVTTKVGLLSFPTTLKVTSNLTGVSGFDAVGLRANLAGDVVATADIMGSKCAIPLKLHLTTGKSGALTGVSFQADKKGVQRGRLVDGTFAVPAIQPSATCNAVVATLSNTLLGLPLAAGASSVGYDASIVIQ